MVNQIKNSITSILYERMSSSFYGAFVASWFLFNWDLFYLTFFVSEAQVGNKLDYALMNYIDIWHGLIFPFILSLFFITIFPYFINWTYNIELLRKEEKRKLKYSYDGNRRLTIEESLEIRRKIEDLEVDYKEAKQANRNEAGGLKKQVEFLVSERDKFEILSVIYGSPPYNFTDVTEKAKEIYKNTDRIKVENGLLGVDDPSVGVQKTLVICYKNNGFYKMDNIQEGSEWIFILENKK
ncbi:MAG: hypothetical protein WAT52_04535 [Chitinophagales bacterium]